MVILSDSQQPTTSACLLIDHPNAYHEYVLDSVKQFDEVAQGDKDIFLKLFPFHFRADKFHRRKFAF